MYLPISIDISDKKILIIGGGQVAMHKLKTLLLFTKNIKVVGSAVLDEVKNTGIDFLEANYKKEFLDGYFLVYACTNDSDLNKIIKQDAKDSGLLVNVADDARFSDFISPAVYKNDFMSVAVSSDGRDVKKSISWREKIRELFKGETI